MWTDCYPIGETTTGSGPGLILTMLNISVKAISIPIQQLHGLFFDPCKREEVVTFDCLSWTEQSDLNQISMWKLE